MRCQLNDSVTPLPQTAPNPTPPEAAKPSDSPAPAPDTVNDPNRTGDWQPGPSTPVSTALPEVPGYVLEKELGRGGMGVVYQAKQVGLDRTVALKMILKTDFAGA